MVTIAGSKEAARVGKLFKHSVHSVLAAVYHENYPPLDLAASPVATVLLDVGVALPPLPLG
jgi:hypothetical protein